MAIAHRGGEWLDRRDGLASRMYNIIMVINHHNVRFLTLASLACCLRRAVALGLKVDFLRFQSFLAPLRRKKSPDDSDQGVTGERCGGLVFPRASAGKKEVSKLGRQPA